MRERVTFAAAPARATGCAVDRPAPESLARPPGRSRRERRARRRATVRSAEGARTRRPRRAPAGARAPSISTQSCGRTSRSRPRPRRAQPVALGQFRGHGDRGEDRPLFPGRRRAVEAVRDIPRAMKAVESRPSRQRGCAISAERNGMLWRMPSIEKASSASAIASIAASRSAHACRAWRSSDRRRARSPSPPPRRCRCGSSPRRARPSAGGR